MGIIKTLVAFAICLFGGSGAACANGVLAGITHSVKFGADPGLDQLEISGTWTLEGNSNGINLPSEATVFSFDNGRYVQALSAGSFLPIAGGFRYTASTPGITLFKIMNNGTFLIRASGLDLTGTRTTAMGGLTILIGDDALSGELNSVPISRVLGQGEATVGQVVTLDGSSSTDFNANTSLAWTWTIVSQPKGSTEALSSTSGATTSFVPTHNGAYVVRLVANDGITDGIPAVFTVQASGAADDPPAPPGPKNGIVALTSDSPSYLIGESALLVLAIEVATGNPSNEYFFVTTLDDNPIAMTDGGVVADFVYQTPAFTEAGTHVFKTDVYIQNKALARQINDSIVWIQNDIVAIDAALARETDLEIISRLQAQKAADLDEIARLEGELVRNRTRVLNSAILEFTVN